MNPPTGDDPFARWLALRAGQGLLALREELGHADPDALRDRGDQCAHQLLLAELTRWRPGDLVLSEEGVRDDPRRRSADRVWIVDPLDGTREFGEPGRTDWAVHVALWSRSATTDPEPGTAPALGLVTGAVALPARRQVFTSDQPPPYPAARPGRPRIAVSRSRAPAFLPELAAEVGADLVPMGSAGVKIIAVATGEVDAYLHAGGQYEWDSAAPVAVALATGLFASRIDGSTLEYNRADPRLPDLLICRRELSAPLLAAIARRQEER